MKKIKNIFNFSIIAMISFCMMGIIEVNAAEASASDFQVICDPKVLEPGSHGQCYLIAKITEASDPSTGVSKGLDYVVTQRDPSLSKYLEVTKVTPPVDRASVIEAEMINSGAAATVGVAKTAGSGYTCNSTKGECHVFSAKTLGGIKETKMGSGSGAPIQGYDSFTIVGIYNVKLSEDAQKMSNGTCGYLCVYVDYSSDGAGTKLSGGTPSVESLKQCGEVTVKVPPVENPPNGSFASYIVLIGGAFVALGAIVLAQKNNKFMKI